MLNWKLIVEYCPWNVSLQIYKKFATSTTWGNSLRVLWDNFLQENELDPETEMCGQITERLEQFNIKAMCGTHEISLDEE